MISPETPGTTKPSLAQDWLDALRSSLRSRYGVILLITLAAVIGAAFNWSWLVAIGIAPLLIAVLPCAAMCALGLCMNGMIGGSRSAEVHPVAVPKPDAWVGTSLEAASLTPRCSDPTPLRGGPAGVSLTGAGSEECSRTVTERRMLGGVAGSERPGWSLRDAEDTCHEDAKIASRRSLPFDRPLGRLLGDRVRE